MLSRRGAWPTGFKATTEPKTAHFELSFKCVWQAILRSNQKHTHLLISIWNMSFVKKFLLVRILIWKRFYCLDGCNDNSCLLWKGRIFISSGFWNVNYYLDEWIYIYLVNRSFFQSLPHLKTQSVELRKLLPNRSDNKNNLVKGLAQIVIE